MRFSSRWLTVLVCAVIVATVVGSAFLLSGLIRQEVGIEDEGAQHEILIADLLDVYSDRTLQLSPELYHADGRIVGGKYVYTSASEAISISKEGLVSVLDPTYEGEIEILITERITGTEKTVKLRIVSELSYVREVRTREGSKITDTLGMTVGDSYTFDIVTVPAAVSLADYFDFYVTDSKGARVEVFDLSVSGNSVTLTVEGIGRGQAHFVMKNEARGVFFEQAVDFDSSFPDTAFGSAVLDAAASELIDGEALASVARVVLPSEVVSVNFSRAEQFMPALTAVVFETDCVVSATALPLDVAVRVKGLALYKNYIEDEDWRPFAARIYPYDPQASHTAPVVVYHNTKSLDVATGNAEFLEKGESGYTLNERGGLTVDFLSPNSPDYASAVISSDYQHPVYTYTGYRNIGWRDAAGNAVEAADLASVSEGIHIYAAWEAEKYTVTLEDYCAGDVSAELTFHAGSEIAYQPHKDGWTFDGWYLTEEYTERVTPATLYAVAGNEVTLYAKYTATVTLDMRGLQTDGSITGAVYGKPLGESLPLLAAISGWTPHGFYADEGYTAEGYIDPQAPFTLEEAEMTLHAKYTYSLAFNCLDALSGVGLFGATVTRSAVNIYCGLTLGESLAIENADMPLAQLAGNQEWRFDGWTSNAYRFSLVGDAGFGTDVLSSDSMITAASVLTPETATVYAIYRSDITVKTGLMGENTLTSITLTFGCQFGTPAFEAPAISGYTFDGWYSGELKLGENTFTQLSFGKADLFAKYNAEEYTVNVQHPTEPTPIIRFWDTAENDDDCVLNNDTGSGLTGRRVLLPHLPDRAGHEKAWAISFFGVLSDPIDAVLTEDGYLWDVPADIFDHVLLYPVYTPITYTVGFNTHGAPYVEEIEDMSVVYGTAITLPTPEAPEGYSFTGWYTSANYLESEKLASGDAYRIADSITLCAKYEKTVSFVGYYNTLEHTLTYGMNYTGEDAIFVAPPEYDPEISCWTFVGWEDATGGIMSGDFYDYRRTETEYTAVFVRDITLVTGEDFALPEGKDVITVRRGLSIMEQGITLPTDADLTKTGNALNWTLTDWYFYHPSSPDTRLSMRVSDPVNAMSGSIDKIYAEYSATVTVGIVYPSGAPSDSFETEIVLGLPIFEQLDEACAAYFAAEYGRGYYQVGWKIGETIYERDAESGYGGQVVAYQHAGLSLTAAFKPNPYTVHYDAAGGSGVPSVDLFFGTEITLADAPVRTGYVFLHWSDGEGNTYSAGETVSPLITSGSITLTAVWRPAEYTVVLDVAGGDVLDDIAATYNEPFVLPTPVRAHYRFITWKLTEGSTYASGEVVNMTDADGATLTLTALWEPYPYSIFFCTEGGEVLFARGFTVEDRTIVLPTEPPAKLGYTVAWEDYSERLSTLSEDFYVYPVYTPIQYTLSFDLGLGGALYYQQTLTYDQSEMLGAPDPTRPYYYFRGWQIGDAVYHRLDDLLNLASEPSTVTATAIWDAVAYSVSFYDKDGTLIEECLFTVENMTVTPPAVPTVAHYDGVWESYTLEFNWENAVYPIYTPIVYTVEFYADGVLIGSDTYTVEDMNVTPPAVPTKTGYKNEVWENYDLSALTNLTVNAHYTPISYTLTFVIDGMGNGDPALPDVTLSYADMYAIPDHIPHIAGFAYLRWLMPDGETAYLPGDVVQSLTATDGAKVVLSADYKLCSYTVHYDSNGGSPMYADSTLIYFDETTHPFAPIRTGFTFLGWRNGYSGELCQPNDVYKPADMPDGTVVTFTAEWREHSYTLHLMSGSAIYKTYSLKYSEVLTLPTSPNGSITGYTFKGWHYTRSATTYGVGPGGTVTQLCSGDGDSIAFTEYWELTPYKLIFDANGGNGGGTLTVYYNHQVDACGAGVPSAGKNGNKNFDGWYTAASGGSKVDISDNTVVDWTGNRTLYAHWSSSCVATGTEVTLADGTTKRVEELTGDEMLLVWDFVTGEYTVSPILLLIYHGDMPTEVINLYFSDGSCVRVVREHFFYDVGLRAFAYIDASNYTDYIGHSFARMNADGETYGSVVLTDAYVTQETTGAYSVWTAQQINFITNGILSLTPPIFTDFGFVCDENMRYDAEQMSADIENYGLYTYEEWSDVLTYEQFVALNIPCMKIAVGKGLTTVEELRYLISVYVNPEQ